MKTQTNSIRQAFGDTLTNLASKNKKIYVVNADLKSSLFLNKFASTYKSRFIECGVAESNAAAVAAGLAKTGKIVFLSSFSCFSPAINWAVIKQSISYNNANVKIIGSHSGLLSGDLGATHQMLEDIALMRSMPNMDVFAPIDAIETEKIVKSIIYSPKPAYIRLVRPPTPLVFNKRFGFTIGKSHLLKTGKDVTVVGHGPILGFAFEAFKDETSPSLEFINCSSIKPLDLNTLEKSLKKTKKLLVLEDHQKQGGLGELIASALLAKNISLKKFVHLGIDNSFGRSAKTYQELYDYYGVGINNIKLALKRMV